MACPMSSTPFPPCVVGGVSLSGGVGKVSGAIIGVIIFTIISYGLTFIGLNPNWQLIIKGLIIIAAVALDMQQERHRVIVSEGEE